MEKHKHNSATAVLSQSKCVTCTAKCCQYVASQIDTPSTKEDLDDIRWYLAHDIWVFYEESDEDGREWYIQVNSPCKYLDSSFKCTIYESRPSICRSYSEDECEHEGEEDTSVMFRSMEEFDEFLRVTPFDEIIEKPAK